MEAKLKFELYLKPEFKKIDTCFPWIKTKKIPIKVSKVIFWKYLHFDCTKSVSQKEPKVSLLSSVASQNTMATLF